MTCTESLCKENPEGHLLVIREKPTEFQKGNEDAKPTTLSFPDKKATNVIASSYSVKEEERDPGALYVSGTSEYCKNPYNIQLLPMLPGTKEVPLCQIKLIYGAWAKPSKFEKLFNFILICLDDEFTDNRQRHKLWKKIETNFHQWVKLLPQEKEAQLLSEYTGDFLSKQCKLAFINDKVLTSEMESAVPIILVSKNILQCQSDGFYTYLTKNLRNQKKLYFELKFLEEYFFFDSKDYEKGFVKNVGQNMSNTASLNDSKSPKHLPIKISNRVENLPEPEKDEDISNQEDALLISKNRHLLGASKSTQTAPNKSKQTEIQIPRNFKQNPENVTYHEGKVFLQPENDGTLSRRCTEFKAFFTFKEKGTAGDLGKFLQEVIRFSCGCLNLRRNGTIYFGIADSKLKVGKKSYKDGEVVGFDILNEDGQDYRAKYSDSLRDGIKRCFDSEVVSAALKCISDPIFVPVVTSETGNVRCVMEVDVEPASNICEKLHFKVNLKKIPNFKTKYSENEYILFLRNGASTVKLKDEKEQCFIKEELPLNVDLRRDFEEREKRNCDFILGVVFGYALFVANLKSSSGLF